MLIRPEVEEKVVPGNIKSEKLLARIRLQARNKLLIRTKLLARIKLLARTKLLAIIKLTKATSSSRLKINKNPIEAAN